MKELDHKLRALAQAEETPLPEDFEARLGETLSALPEGQRSRRPLRAAVLAACVCLALVGTVLAAESGIFARIVRPGDPGFHDIREELPYELGYDVAGNWVVTTPAGAIPTEKFSQDIRTLAAEAAEQYAWTSAEDWQAAEDLVGRELPRFPLLAGQPGRTIYRSGGTGGADEVLGSCLVEVFTDGDGALTNVSVRECVEMTGEDQGLAVDVSIQMATEAGGRKEFQQCLTLSPGLLEVMQQSDWQTAWGGTAVILQGGTAWEAVVDWHGCMVSLAVSGIDNGQALLRALLDGME